jgi:hypothetical protein
MKMHAVVYDQLGASAYTIIILCAWKKSLSTEHDAFLNTIAVSFSFRLQTYIINGCTAFAFISCSYSTGFYVFGHFIPNPHLHFDADRDDNV